VSLLENYTPCEHCGCTVAIECVSCGDAWCADCVDASDSDATDFKCPMAPECEDE
jgi:hypothetical protein